jgi:hypothetical protein
LIGGRVALQFASRFSVDATIQRVQVTNEHSFDWGAESGSALDEVAATFVAVQPHVRLRVADSVHATFGVGPVMVFSQRSTPQAPGAADTRMGMAFSAALRMQIRGALDLELRASDYMYLEANASGPRQGHDLTYGVGLALALNRRSP